MPARALLTEAEILAAGAEAQDRTHRKHGHPGELCPSGPKAHDRVIARLRGGETNIERVLSEEVA